MLALHVHHGLSAHADAWQAHCAERCRRWARAGNAIEFAAHRVVARPATGDSVEAWARRARYRALRAMAVEHDVDLVLLGHHLRDQAETFVLQALRGGGVAALSAMPALARRDGVSWARPWLDVPRAAIEAYARAHRLRWIDDDSNGEERFARNRLRERVWPALIGAFADAEVSLADAARWAQEATGLGAEIAALDLASIADARGLDLSAWRRLSNARQSAALRRWLADRASLPAPATLVERVMDEAEPRGTQRWPFAAGELRCYRGVLSWAPRLVDDSVHEPTSVDLSRAGVHAIAGWHGAFLVERVARGGIAVEQASRLVLRTRLPGDRFQLGRGRPPRSLKLQYQDVGVPENERTGPIACDGDGDAIVFVPRLGVDARATAGGGAPQVMLTWLPDAPAEAGSAANDAG